MSRDDIIRMAREAGFTLQRDERLFTDMLEHFAALVAAALAQQDEPVEPVAWKQGNLVTFNEDPCPVLGGLFVQFWDGEEVAARVYANDLETLRQRCAKVNTAPPQRKLVPLTEEQVEPAQDSGFWGRVAARQASRIKQLETAAQQALEALEWHYHQGHSNTLGGFRLKIDEKALRYLRAAIKAAEGELR